MRILDCFLFVLMVVASAKWYMTPHYFDVLVLVSLLYCAFRRRENVNIISLCFILIIFKLVNAGMMSGVECMKPIVYFGLMLFINVLVLGLIWTRPTLLSQIGPFKHRSGWTITNADDMLGLVFILMILFDILLIIEQALRYIGFNARWFYGMYENIQLAFAIVSIAVLMGIIANDKASAKSKTRNK